MQKNKNIAVIKHLGITVERRVTSKGRLTGFDVRIKGRKISAHHQGNRYVYIDRKAKMVIKVESDMDADLYYSQCEQENMFYKKMLHKEDAKYFPKQLAYSRKFNGIVVQKYIPLSHSMRIASRKKVCQNIVSGLVKKYHLGSDVLMDCCFNWAFKKGTNHPIIYDMGCIEIEK